VGVGRAEVALFVRPRHDAVAAHGGPVWLVLAGGRASVATDAVPVVAGLGANYVPIAAGRGARPGEGGEAFPPGLDGQAIRRAPVAANRVPVVAGLPYLKASVTARTNVDAVLAQIR